MKFYKIEIASHIAEYSKRDFERLGYEWQPIWDSILELQKAVNAGSLAVDGCEFDPQYDHFPGGRLPYCIEMLILDSKVGQVAKSIYLLGNWEHPAIFDLVVVSVKQVAIK